MKLFILELFTYLFSSIPFGLVVSKIFKKVDIREYGSHNIGSTNVARILGKKFGLIVLLLDGLKAVIPLFLVKYFFGYSEFLLALTAIVAVMGHIFSIWLKFKGGKGVATTLFSLLYIDYRIGLVFIILWLLVFLLFRVSSISALVSIFFTTIFVLSISRIYFAMMLIIDSIIFYKHKENITRIINGEELSFNKK